MVNNMYLLLICFIFSSKLIPAQDLDLKLQPEEPSYLPVNSVNVKKSPSYTPKSELINAIEQNGLYPYKGHECDNLSMSFVEVDDGKHYGSNEFLNTNLKIIQYGPQGKQLFDQLKPFDFTTLIESSFK